MQAHPDERPLNLPFFDAGCLCRLKFENAPTLLDRPTRPIAYSLIAPPIAVLDRTISTAEERVLNSEESSTARGLAETDRLTSPTT